MMARTPENYASSETFSAHQVFNFRGKGLKLCLGNANDMLLQIESDLNSLSVIVGLKSSESYQGDPAKILKKTSQIISNVKADTAHSLLKRA